MNRAFLSYPYADSKARRVMEGLVPKILYDHRIESWDTTYSLRIGIGESIYDSIVAAIRRSDLVISDVSRTNTNVSYELGIVHAWGIPSILITRDIDLLPFDIAYRYQVIPYGEGSSGDESFTESFSVALKSLIEQPPSKLPKIYDRYLSRSNAVRIELFETGAPSITIFNLIAELTEAIGDIEDIGDSRLEEIRVGSFGVWISANIEAVLSLAEKIIFFVPETRKKWQEGNKLKEEAAFIRSQTNKVDAETRSIEDENYRKNVDKFLDVVERFGGHGKFRISFGDRLRIEAAPNAPLSLDKPDDNSEPNVEQGGQH